MRGNQGNTKATRKDPRYIEIFDRMRDMEYTVGEARWVASDAVALLNQHPDWTIEQAIREVLK